jgi:hypothetical protein
MAGKKAKFPQACPFLKRIKNATNLYLSFLEIRKVGKLAIDGKSSTHKKVSRLLRYFYFAKIF